MVKALFLSFVAVLFLLTAQAYAGAPHSIAGFTLEENVQKYRDKIIPGSEMPIRHLEYLMVADVKVPPGFKSGQIVFGACKDPGRIVKISVKYMNTSRDFFDKLLERFKEKFGEPREWKGDPFHVYVAWKWSLVDRKGRRISMTLQHYSGDEDVYKKGNSVKLSINELIEGERQCYEKKHPELEEKKAAESRKGKKVNFEDLIPK